MQLVRSRKAVLGPMRPLVLSLISVASLLVLVLHAQIERPKSPFQGRQPSFAKKGEYIYKAEYLERFPRPLPTFLKLRTREECTPQLSVVVSYGGVGTTLLIRALEKLGVHINDPGDHDLLKHQPAVREREELLWRYRCPWEEKVGALAYLFDDPVHAIFSLYRRNYHNSQALKTRTTVVPTHTALSYANSGSQNEDMPETLALYAAEGKDIMELGRHLAGYLKLACSPNATHSTLFLRSSMRYKYDKDVYEFFNVDYDNVAESQRAQEYTMDWEKYFDNVEAIGSSRKEAQAARKQLVRTYKKLTDLLTRIGDFRIVHGGDCDFLNPDDLRMDEWDEQEREVDASASSSD